MKYKFINPELPKDPYNGRIEWLNAKETIEKYGDLLSENDINELEKVTQVSWPIDPNAPKNTIQEYINKGYNIGVIGSHASMHDAIYKHMALGAELVVINPNEGKMPFDILKQIDNIDRIKPEVFEIKTIHFEDNFTFPSKEKYVHKITPQEQRRRERFRRK